MSKWTKVSGPRAYEAPYGRAAAWTYRLASAKGETVTTSVEVAGTATPTANASAACTAAIASKGWSAIQPFIDQNVLPRKLLVTARGVSISEQGAD